MKDTSLLKTSLIICGIITAVSGAHAQTSILNATYGPSGTAAATTSGTFSLNQFTVTGIYTSNSTTTEAVYITDGTANGRIFGSDSLFAGLTVGSQATATVVDSVYQGYEEFKTPTNIVIASTTATAAPVQAMLSQVASTVNGTTNPFTLNPSDSLYNSSATPGGPTEGQELMNTVSFNITPTTSGTTSTSGSVTLTDATTGDTVVVYRSSTAIAYSAGVPYTVTGIEQPFAVSGTEASEIVGATSFTSMGTVPEPSSVIAGGLTCVVGAVTFLRRRKV